MTQDSQLTTHNFAFQSSGEGNKLVQDVNYSPVPKELIAEADALRREFADLQTTESVDLIRAERNR